MSERAVSRRLSAAPAEHEWFGSALIVAVLGTVVFVSLFTTIAAVAR